MRRRIGRGSATPTHGAGMDGAMTPDMQSRLPDGPVAPVITLFHPGESSCDIWLKVGHLREAGHAAWRVTAHHGHDCLAGLGG